MEQYHRLSVNIKDSAAIITLNHGKVNAYDPLMVEELGKVMLLLNEQKDVSAVILVGNGKSFSCGADVTYLVQPHIPVYKKVTLCADLRNVLDTVRESPHTYVAALNGHALGGGLEIALACDARISRSDETQKLLIGFPEITLGLMPAAGGIGNTLELTAYDMRKALEILASGTKYTPGEAQKLGLINEICSENELLEKAVQLAQRVGKKQRLAMPDVAPELRYHDVMYDAPFRTMSQEAIKTIISALNLQFSESDRRAIAVKECDLLTQLYLTEFTQKALAALSK